MSELHPTAPCPACDCNGQPPLVAFAMGVSLGAAFTDMHKVTEMMCAAHRMPYVMAMMHAQVAINTTEEGSTPSSLFDEALAENEADLTGSKSDG